MGRTFSAGKFAPWVFHEHRDSANGESFPSGGNDPGQLQALPYRNIEERVPDEVHSYNDGRFRGCKHLRSVCNLYPLVQVVLTMRLAAEDRFLPI